jgi:DNA-binding NarL/FixJ family response regulator
MAPTVVIVDDHATFRASARKLLQVEGYEVVGEAADVASAIAVVERLRPDVVLLDVVLPDGTGFDVAERLAGGSATVVLVSSRDRGDLGPRLARTKAAGFIPKDELSGETLAAVVSERA